MKIFRWKMLLCLLLLFLCVITKKYWQSEVFLASFSLAWQSLNNFLLSLSLSLQLYAWKNVIKAVLVNFLFFITRMNDIKLSTLSTCKIVTVTNDFHFAWLWNVINYEIIDFWKEFSLRTKRERKRRMNRPCWHHIVPFYFLKLIF